MTDSTAALAVLVRLAQQHAEQIHDEMIVTGDYGPELAAKMRHREPDGVGFFVLMPFERCTDETCAAARAGLAPLLANWKGLNEAIKLNYHNGFDSLYQTASYFRVIDELLGSEVSAEYPNKAAEGPAEASGTKHPSTQAVPVAPLRQLVEQWVGHRENLVVASRHLGSSRGRTLASGEILGLTAAIDAVESLLGGPRPAREEKPA